MKNGKQRSLFYSSFLQQRSLFYSIFTELTFYSIVNQLSVVANGPLIINFVYTLVMNANNRVSNLW